MGFYFNQKDLDLNPLSFLSGFSRSTGRSTAAWSRSTESVDRRTQTCTPLCTGGPVDRAGRPPESLCSLENPGRPSGRPTEKLFSVPEARSDRCPNGQKNDRWRSTGQSTGSSVRPPTASFWSPINWAIWGLFWLRFLESFCASFFYSFKRFFSTCVRANISNQKGSFIKSVLKVSFLSFSSTISILVFSQTLEQPIDIFIL